jgi:hypothetical protein
VAKLTVTCLSFKPLRKNTLRGFADIRIAEMRLNIRDVAVHQKGAGRWAQLPARPMIDKDGVVIRDRVSGKIQYANLFDFDTSEVRDAFSRAVIAAVVALVPEAFDEPSEVAT